MSHEHPQPPTDERVVASVDAEGRVGLMLDSSVMSQAVYLYRPILDGSGSVVDLQIVLVNEAARHMPFSDGMVPGALASEVFVDMQLALDAANAVVRGEPAESYTIERAGLLEGHRLLVRYDVSTFAVAMPGPEQSIGVGQVAMDRTWMSHAAEADTRFRMMAEASNDGLMLLTSDAEGVLLVEYANPVVCANDPRIHVGYPLPADLSAFARAALADVPVGRSARREYDSTSSVRPMRVDITFTRLNEAQVLVTVRELTSEELARAELERSDALLRAIATGAFGTLVVYEPHEEHGVVVGMRATWSAHGKSRPTDRHPLTAADVPEAVLVHEVNALRADGRAARFGWLTVTDDEGLERSVEYAVVPAGDRYVVEFVERTDELALRTELATVTAAAEAQRAFLSRISHELRSPLNVIHGYTQLLARMRLPGLADHHVELIDRGVRRMVSVVDDLLLLGHLDQGLVDVEQRVVVLGDVIDEVVRKVGVVADSGSTPLRLLAPAGRLTVRTDPSRLSDALAYLLTACLEATDGVVEFGAYVRGATVGLQIAVPAGSSLPGEVWRPFVGGQGLPGNGLGLAVARALLQALGVAGVIRDSPGADGDTVLVLPLEPVG